MSVVWHKLILKWREPRLAYEWKRASRKVPLWRRLAGNTIYFLSGAGPLLLFASIKKTSHSWNSLVIIAIGLGLLVCLYAYFARNERPGIRMRDKSIWIGSFSNPIKYSRFSSYEIKAISFQDQKFDLLVLGLSSGKRAAYGIAPDVDKTKLEGLLQKNGIVSTNHPIAKLRP